MHLKKKNILGSYLVSFWAVFTIRIVTSTLPLRGNGGPLSVLWKWFWFWHSECEPFELKIAVNWSATVCLPNILPALLPSSINSVRIVIEWTMLFSWRSGTTFTTDFQIAPCVLKVWDGILLISCEISSCLLSLPCEQVLEECGYTSNVLFCPCWRCWMPPAPIKIRSRIPIQL